MPPNTDDNMLTLQSSYHKRMNREGERKKN